ncbi:stage V sporulation protein AB [Mangrovibacillus cuniculi]|uniref:Stage V sporulation protein AB n=1 Tax=Mangrovibacillus cuniculi TaxID=2593652 RepID=A0A7S8CB84_9BACI|nr:stage V sporulation protein AB [Mangrovibacillus cuniculi]QPC46752.1 stage V sporulation protein AB [Mangrovibacillus cuniculi]
MTINVLLIILIAFAGGLAVGSGFVAVLTVLGIIPRLTQLTKTMKMIHYYEWSVVFGVFLGCYFSLQLPSFHLYPILLMPLGLLNGIFLGMLAAALTESLNVLPILAKRVGIADRIVYLLMALVFGKIMGSLFHWIYYVSL